MKNTQTTTKNILTHKDIRDFLTGFAASIELDQIRVDALAPEKFHPLYEDSLWRNCRSNHLKFIRQLLLTVNTVSWPLLQSLTELAIGYEPATLREMILDEFSEAANGTCCPEEVETAELFFGWLIKAASRARASEKALNGDARGLMMQWFSVTDPLRISEDSECGYGPLPGFVS